MAGKVRFYRGAQGTSLPATPQDGAIFIIERANSSDGIYPLGDMYVDMDNGTRLHITPDSELLTYNSSLAQVHSTLGQPYIFQETNPEKIGIAIGDGNASIGDLPIYNYTTVNAIKHKINAYLGTDYISSTSAEDRQKDGLTIPSSNSELAETLVLSREV